MTTKTVFELRKANKLIAEAIAIVQEAAENEPVEKEKLLAEMYKLDAVWAFFYEAENNVWFPSLSTSK